MNILLHVCCGPCAVHPLDVLRRQGHEVTGYFFNPNIHPYREFCQRLRTLEEFAQKKKFEVEVERSYGLVDYLRRVVFHEGSRCSICYDLRLLRTVERAMTGKFDAFTTTLLYSKHQKHELLASKCASLAKQFGTAFFYHDFREGWQQGIDESIAMNLYRQSYCGCIYSEQERYDKTMRKKKPRPVDAEQQTCQT